MGHFAVKELPFMLSKSFIVAVSSEEFSKFGLH